MGIFCLEPRRVAITGKVRAFALDKTGTLTQAWLDFLAVQPAQAVPMTSNPRTGESTLHFEEHVCVSTHCNVSSWSTHCTPFISTVGQQ